MQTAYIIHHLYIILTQFNISNVGIHFNYVETSYYYRLFFNFYKVSFCILLIFFFFSFFFTFLLRQVKQNRTTNRVKGAAGNCSRVNQRFRSLPGWRYPASSLLGRWKNFLLYWLSLGSTLGRSYPRFNYRYQVTCSSFRVPEQLTLLRVHRMQMTSRPSIRPSIRLSVHPFLVRQGGREGCLIHIKR